MNDPKKTNGNPEMIGELQDESSAELSEREGGNEICSAEFADGCIITDADS